MGHLSSLIKGFNTPNPNSKNRYFFIKVGVSWCVTSKALRNILPTTEELSGSYMEMLPHIFLDYRADVASYISKEITEEDLRLAGVYLVERRCSPFWVITSYIFLYYRSRFCASYFCV